MQLMFTLQDTTVKQLNQAHADANLLLINVENF